MPPETFSDAACRNPVGTHVEVGPGLVKGALAGAGRIGAEALQVFAGNPRGWGLAPGDSAGDPALRRVREGLLPVDTLDRLVAVAGADRLRLVHANDSKDVRGAAEDRQEQVGRRHIGVDAFGELPAHPATEGVPFILESPGSRDPGDPDIALLRALRDEIAPRRLVPRKLVG